MIRSKIKIKLEEGVVKEAIIDAISVWEATPTIRTQEALWDLVHEEFPKLKGIPAHFSYNPLTKSLTLGEGRSSKSWVPFTF